MTVAHLEGVLTLVSASGPWFRVQGRHLRPPDAPRIGLRLALDPNAGIVADLHLGETVWIRAGWYPEHLHCRPLHRCWGRWLTPRIFERGPIGGRPA